jgi:outer membrane protein assembly factor BamB
MTKRFHLSIAIALLFLCMLTSIKPPTATAQTPWPSWRGPNGNGTATEGTYPSSWSEQEQIAWKLDLPGRGASTPVVMSDDLYLTLGKNETNTLMCIGIDGKTKWEKGFGKERPAKHAKASGSNSSPITDGKSVFVYFKSGDLASVTSQGEINWSVNIQDKYGEDSLWWDLGTSPVLTDKAIVIAVMQTGPSFLLALNKDTGAELWKADRWMDVPEEANQSYTTPVLGKHKSGDALYTVGADYVTAHSAADGKLLWKLGGFNPTKNAYFRSIASPVFADDFVICPYARGATVSGLRTAHSDVQDLPTRMAWQKDFGSDVPTPAYYEGKIILLGDKGLVTCLKPDSGDTIWSQQLPKSNRQFSSSPIVADGKIYCTREDATTFVLSKTGELLNTNKLEGNAVATPVFANGNVYLRTFESLYAIQTNTSPTR